MLLQQTIDETPQREVEQTWQEAELRAEELLRERLALIEAERLRRGKSLPRVVHGRN